MHPGRNGNRASQIVLIIFAGIGLWIPLSAQTKAPAPQWLPNHQPPDAHFVGTKACADCHSDKVASQTATAMGKALEMPEHCQILQSHAKLTFKQAAYNYEIIREGDRSIYKVTDGTRTIAEPVLYAFGQGVAGQTYVFKHEGNFYESRVSYFGDVKGLDLTIGHLPEVPESLDGAAGRVMKTDEARACFGCHTTGAVSRNTLQVERLVPGVTCEQCHGPAEKHVAAMRAGNYDESFIFNPRGLNAEEISNFCGACHRTWETVALMGLRGVNNVRFQPYRLANSKCYDQDDNRIACTACHDPHADVRRDAVYYDSKCTACHKAAIAEDSKDRRVKVCPVAKDKCVTCHMPKYDLPGGHFKFTDHEIRIVKSGDRYPN
jgi:hypothetical protein